MAHADTRLRHPRRHVIASPKAMRCFFVRGGVHRAAVGLIKDEACGIGRVLQDIEAQIPGLVTEAS